MTWLRLAFANLSLSPLTSAVNVLLMALGTASIVLLLLAGSQLSDTMSRDAKGIDLVLGAKGSPVQLVLAAVYHADVPPGNIPLEAADRWANDARIAQAIPLSLGDSYRGFRIVGTTRAYADLYDAEIASGRYWTESMEAVVGSAVGQAAALDVGSQFAGAHGLADGGHTHDYAPYDVVGVLAPTGTVVDRLILTSLESVWDLHAEDAHHHHDQDHEHVSDADKSAGDGHDHGDHDHGEHDHDDHSGHDHGHEADDADHDHAHDGDHGHEHGNGHDDQEARHDHDHGDDHAHDHEADHAHDHEHDHEYDDKQPSDHDHGGEHVDDDEHAHNHNGEHAHGDEDHAHDHGQDEITAMLLQYRSPMAAVALPRQINADAALQAAAPAMEVSRILQLIGIGLDGLEAFAWVLILTAALSVFAALYGSLRSRRRDLAMLRCLGATRGELLVSMLLEGLLLSVVGVALGFAIGHVAMEVLGGLLENARGVALSGWIWLPEEWILMFSLFAVGAVAAAIPAIQAYRTDPARTLAEA